MFAAGTSGMRSAGTNPTAELAATPISTFETYLDRAIEAAGLTPGNLAILWQDFEQGTSVGTPPGGWTTNLAGSGDIDEPANVGGGVPRFTTGATGNSRSGVRSARGMISAVKTTRWYCAVRFRLGTAVDAASIIGMGLISRDQSKTIQICQSQALHAANYVLQYDGLHAGSAVNLGVPVDNGTFHIGEFCCRADSKLYTRMDSDTFLTGVTMGVAAPADALGAFVLAQNINAVDRRLEPDWILVVAERS